jgi:hypothetical protein
MVVAFGLGMYVILTPNNMPIAILILVFSLFLGSPFLLSFSRIGKRIVHFLSNLKGHNYALGCTAAYGLIFLMTFCLAFL